MSVLKTHLYRDGVYVGEVPTPQTVLDYLQKKANAKLAEDLAEIDRELNSHGPIFAEATKAAERDVSTFIGDLHVHAAKARAPELARIRARESDFAGFYYAPRELSVEVPSLPPIVTSRLFPDWFYFRYTPKAVHPNAWWGSAAERTAFRERMEHDA